MFSSTELVWPKGTPGGELALTTACNLRHSYSSIWGPCSFARCRRHTSEFPARSHPSSNASRWLCRPTRYKGFHLWERGKTQWGRVGLTMLTSSVHTHPQRKHHTLVGWTSLYPLTSNVFQSQEYLIKTTTGNSKPKFSHQDRHLFPWKKLGHSSFSNLGVYSVDGLARWGHPRWRHTDGALILWITTEFMTSCDFLRSDSQGGSQTIRAKWPSLCLSLIFLFYR